MELSSSFKTFIEKLKTNRQTQITAASIVLLVVVIIGGIIFAKVTNDKKRGISPNHIQAINMANTGGQIKIASC